jgi:hypothetical protein
LSRGIFLIVTAVTTAVGAGLFRLACFGSWFPLPVSAKVAGISFDKIRLGERYVRHNTVQDWNVLLWVLAGAGFLLVVVRCVRKLESPSLLVTSAAFALAYGAFVVTSGGDWMVAGRFLVPLFPSVAILAVAAGDRLTKKRFRKAGLALIVVPQLIGAVSFARISPGLPIWCSPPESVRLQANMEASWPEQQSRETAPAFFIAERLEQIVAALRLELERPIVVLTGQMGLVPYRLTQRLTGDIRWVDRWGLTTRDFLDSPISANNPRVQVGIVVTYGFYFQNHEAFKKHGPLGHPDVIFDWDWLGEGSPRTLFEKNGYTIVHRQGGLIQSECKYFPGSRVTGRMFIAVRDDLAHAAGPPTTRTFR